MKKFTIILAILAVGCFISAQDMSVSDVDYVKSHGIFSYSNLCGQYTQTKTMAQGAKSFKSYGDIIISPQNGIVWKAYKPYESLLIISKDSITQQIRNNPPKKLIMSDNVVYVQIATSLECVFFGDFDTMFSVFDVDFSQNQDNWLITLTPKDDLLGDFVSRIIISGTNNIDSLLLEESTGDSILYEFSNLMQRNLTDEELSLWEK